MTQLNLVIRNGRVVTKAMDAVADAGISDGKVVQVGGVIEGWRKIDASWKLVLPGGFDAHVQPNSPPGRTAEPSWVDDFTNATKHRYANTA